MLFLIFKAARSSIQFAEYKVITRRNSLCRTEGKLAFFEIVKLNRNCRVKIKPELYNDAKHDKCYAMLAVLQKHRMCDICIIMLMFSVHYYGECCECQRFETAVTSANEL